MAKAKIGDIANLPVFTGENGILGVKDAAAALEALNAEKKCAYTNYMFSLLNTSGSGWYRMYKITNINACILAIQTAYNHNPGESAILAITPAWNACAISMIGRCSLQNVITKVRVTPGYFVDVYYAKSVANPVYVTLLNLNPDMAASVEIPQLITEEITPLCELTLS